MLQVLAVIVERHTEGASQEVRLRAPELARTLAPGRAALLRTGARLQPYLRRTFYPIAYDDDTFTVRVTPGDDWGHAWLRAAPTGSTVDCLGPVGNGFAIPPAAHNIVVLAEGEAAWTLLPALLLAQSAGKNVTLACTAAGRAQLVPVQRLPAHVEYHLEVGGHSHERRLRFAGSIRPLLAWSDTLLAAGSLDFYAWLIPAVQAARFVLNRGYAQILYPGTFFCGVGACQNCVADVAGGRRRVCLRGPVFDLLDVAQ